MSTDQSDIVERLLVEWDSIKRQIGTGSSTGPDPQKWFEGVIAEITRAALAAETERCARVAEQKVKRVSFEKPGGEIEVLRWNDGPEIAAAIRAGG